MKGNVVVRMEPKQVAALDQLAKAKGKDRSFVIREAVDQYLAAYTGEPDINDISVRLRKLESRVNELAAQQEAAT